MQDIRQSEPLQGVRVLDLGTMIAGPVAATLLGEFGAEVIKIEQPIGGDSLRQIGPFVEGESLWFALEGRNKHSITLDLRQPEGQDLLKRLAAEADVLVENFRPGTMDNWGIGFEKLHSVNKKLIMLSASCFGQTGPYAKRAGYDRMALAFGGLLNSTGYADRPPVRPGCSLADYQTAMTGAFAIMLALFQREIHDTDGQHIDLALYEPVFRFMDVMVPAFQKLGIERGRAGNLAFAAAPGEHFKTSDGHFVVVTVSSDPMFRKLCEAIGREDLVGDRRFITHDDRCRNLTEINDLVARWIGGITLAELKTIFVKHGVAFAPILAVKDIVTNEHYIERQNILEIDHPRLGTLKMPARVPRLPLAANKEMRVAETLGASNGRIYREVLGLGEDEVEGLKERGVI